MNGRKCRMGKSRWQKEQKAFDKFIQKKKTLCTFSQSLEYAHIYNSGTRYLPPPPPSIPPSLYLHQPVFCKYFFCAFSMLLFRDLGKMELESFANFAFFTHKSLLQVVHYICLLGNILLSLFYFFLEKKGGFAQNEQSLRSHFPSYDTVSASILYFPLKQSWKHTFHNMYTKYPPLSLNSLPLLHLFLRSTA